MRCPPRANCISFCTFPAAVQLLPPPPPPPTMKQQLTVLFENIVKDQRKLLLNKEITFIRDKHKAHQVWQLPVSLKKSKPSKFEYMMTKSCWMRLRHFLM